MLPQELADHCKLSRIYRTSEPRSACALARAPDLTAGAGPPRRLRGEPSWASVGHIVSSSKRPAAARTAGAKVWSEINAQDWLRESVHEHPKPGPPDRRPARRAVPRSLPG